MHRRLFLVMALVTTAAIHAAEYTLQLDTIHSGFDKETCWVHPRAGAIPGETPSVVLTMQKLLLSGSDVFYALNEMRTDDLGKTWSGPTEHATLGRRPTEGGGTQVVCDFTPKWHAASGKLLGTGHTAMYTPDNALVHGNRPRSTAYAVYNDAARTWSEWRTMDMPDLPLFYNNGAGSTQRVDLPNGDILLPIYCKPIDTTPYSTVVVRARFDGETLHYLEHGAPLSLDVERGLAEPSLAQCNGRYFLTLRNDVKGYVARGDDGLNFDTPIPWTFDDGTELGSYNTQQHWVTHGKTLYLVYTRRGANNDHVFRHRAPLFIAEVDQENLQVIRSTERILVPERGARLGNFAVTEVNDRETWVTVAEWMQPAGVEKYGSDNSVFVARIKWNQD